MEMRPPYLKLKLFEVLLPVEAVPPAVVGPRRVGQRGPEGVVVQVPPRWHLGVGLGQTGTETFREKNDKNATTSIQIFVQS